MGRRRWQREELHYIRKQPSSMHKTSCVCPVLSDMQTCLPSARLAPSDHWQSPEMLSHGLQHRHL